jgi:hypothetical protein
MSTALMHLPVIDALLSLNIALEQNQATARNSQAETTAWFLADFADQVIASRQPGETEAAFWMYSKIGDMASAITRAMTDRRLRQLRPHPKGLVCGNCMDDAAYAARGPDADTVFVIWKGSNPAGRCSMLSCSIVLMHRSVSGP